VKVEAEGVKREVGAYWFNGKAEVDCFNREVEAGWSRWGSRCRLESMGK
jgi:hypothetical protein